MKSLSVSRYQLSVRGIHLATQGQYEQAITAASKACELGDWKDWSDVKTLAAAYAASADFRQAVKWQTKTLEMAPDDAKEEEKRVLGLYDANTPYSEPDDAEE